MGSKTRLGGYGALLAAAAVVVVIVLLLLATDTLLSVWERLDRIAPWLGTAYLLVLAAIAAGTGWFVWRMFAVRPQRRDAPRLSQEDLDQRIERQSERGVDVQASRDELDELQRRRQQERLYLALFGEASAGKSTLIQALLPGASVRSDPRAGTTQELDYYDWARDDLGDPEHISVQLVDVPGFGQAGAADLGEIARQEAVRAHLVLYVCDGDLTRTQVEALQGLAEFHKPLVVVLNKADRYSAEELGLLEERIHSHLDSVPAISVVAVTAGGAEEVQVETDQGLELQSRQRPAEIGPLTQILERILSGNEGQLEQGQETASLQLAAMKLDAAEQQYRRQQSDTLVERYARRAVIGALAAVTPGTDLVIQGALATALVRELTELHEIPVQDIDVDRFVELAGGRIGKATSIVLAVAGNAFKAFPGIGTLAGGLIHAVAYGLIFDSLGRAVSACLEERAQLDTEDALERLEEQLESDLSTRARHLARLALGRSDRPD